MMTQRPHHMIEYVKKNMENVCVVYFDRDITVEQSFWTAQNRDRFSCIKKRMEENVLYLGIPESKHYDCEKRLILDRMIMKEFLIEHFSNSKFDVCILSNPLSAVLLETLKKYEIASLLVYEDLDDFAEYYSNNIPKWRKYIKEFEKYIIENADIVFSVSESLKAFRENQGFIQKNHYVSNNGVKFDLFKSDAAEERENSLIFIGALEEWAGVQFAIKGFKKALEMGIKADFKILGEGPYEIHLRRLVKDLKLTGNIQFYGRIEYYKIPDYLKKSKLGIITFEESNLTTVAHPIKIIEYMASGLVVLGVNFGEIAKIINDSGAGVVVNDTNEFAYMLKILLSDNNLYKRLQTNTVNFAKNFDWNLIYRREFEVIKNICPDKNISKSLILDEDKTIGGFCKLFSGCANFSLKELFKKLEKRWSAAGYKNIAIYGAGEHTEKLLRHLDFSKLKIAALIDSNEALIGQKKCGYEIIALNQVVDYAVDLILISSQQYEDEIFKSIKDFCHKKNISIYRLYAENRGLTDLIWRDIYFGR
jgi:glycosyltransferase involved in cell wall biosynthesis